MIGVAGQTWRERPELRTPGAARRGCCGCGWTAEAARLAGERLRQQLAAGQPGPGGVGHQARLRPAQPGDLRRSSWSCRGEEALRYDDWTMRRPTIVDFLGRSAGLPLPAGQGQLHRGRHLGDPAQHRRRAGARPARRAARRQGRRLEGPAAMTDLLYSEVEEDLRAAVRSAAGRPHARSAACWPGSRPARRTTRTCGRRSPAEMGAGRPGRARAARRGRGASLREAAVVLEELGRGVAPVPYLASAVVATTALLAARRGRPAWPSSAAGQAIAVLAVPFATAPGVRLGRTVAVAGRRA